MKAKPAKKSEFSKTTPLRKRPSTSKDFSFKEPKFLNTVGNDAEAIRKEVMRVKASLKHSSRLFEQLGAIRHPKFKKN